MGCVCVRIRSCEGFLLVVSIWDLCKSSELLIVGTLDVFGFCFGVLILDDAQADSLQTVEESSFGESDYEVDKAGERDFNVDS